MMSEPDFKKPMISVVGLHCQELGGMIGLIDESGDSKARKICSEIVYRDDINLLQQSHAQETFQQHLEDPDELDTFITSAQRAAVIFMRQALKGLTPKVEAALPPHLVHYVEWIRGRYSLAVQGLLRGQDSKDTWFSTGDSADRDFLSDFKNSCEDAKLLAAIGNNLSEIFEGSKSSLDVMMQDDMLSKTYAQAHGVVTGVQMIKDWFDLKAHKQPDMKILEVGAGTGSITLPIMQILKPRYESSPRFGSYVFTDISSGFFEPARELLKEWQGLIKFGRLDIEKDPVEQGFEANSFDVIAASNVSNLS
jgi:hypothetical protein